jgi:outer membrane PBP1 activator LpoA protein
MPILALNRTLDGSSNPNLYQFALAPEDEMIQVADQVFREGKKNALIIFPDSDWGERNVTAFRNRWLSLGGNIVNNAAYANQKDYSTMVKSLLDVDLSEGRASNLRRIIGQSFEFTPRRRQDIDFVFLLGNQTQARGINPTLAFYYAEDIPVYSTSHVYEYSESRIESIDLNGIRFCDIPWKLNTPDASQQQLQNLWPGTRGGLAAFYALGVDAFRLYPRLEQMKQLTNERIYGSTGILSLNPNNILVRRLLWAQFANGEVITSPQVVESGEGT